MNAPHHPESTALTVASRQQFDLSPQTFEEALTFSKYLADSDMVPKDFKGRPANCLIAMQWGAELGLKPMQAMQNLAVINGRPSLWGDAVIALVRSSPLCEYVIETDDGTTATCRVKRRGDPAEQVRTFGMDDAKQAGLMGKQGPWTQYPKRMRQMRARAFALRDVFPDVLRGLPVAEELMDVPAAAKDMGLAEVVPPTTAPATYPSEQFAANLPKWQEVIRAGRKTADQIIAMAQSKHPLTEDQKQAIRGAQQQDAPQDVQPKVTYAQVAEKLHAAATQDALDEAATLIEAVTESQRAELHALYEQRLSEVNA